MAVKAKAPVKKVAPTKQAPIKKAAPIRQAPVKQVAPAKQAPIKKAAPVKKPAAGTKLVCEQCGFMVTVDDWGATVDEIFCCEEEMKPKAVKKAAAPVAKQQVAAKVKK